MESTGRLLGKGVVGAPMIEKVVFDFENQPTIGYEMDGRAFSDRIVGIKDSGTNATITSMHIMLEGDKMVVAKITPATKKRFAEAFSLTKKMEKYV